MNDETLIFYYYNDGLSETDRREVSLALQKDSHLADRYQLLVRDLEALRHPGDVVVPDGLEHRLITTIQRAARIEATEAVKHNHSNRTWMMKPSFLGWGSALAATLALGVGIGIWLAPRDSVEDWGDASVGPDVPQLVVEPAQTGDTTWSTVAFHRGLQSYFRSGSTNVAGLSAEQDEDRATMYGALLNQNRLYVQLALNHDAPDVARVLRSFEPVLLLLSGKDIPPEEAAILQARLEFEFRVMLTKFSRGSSQHTESHQQEITL